MPKRIRTTLTLTGSYQVMFQILPWACKNNWISYDDQCRSMRSYRGFSAVCILLEKQKHYKGTTGVPTSSRALMLECTLCLATQVTMISVLTGVGVDNSTPQAFPVKALQGVCFLSLERVRSTLGFATWPVDSSSGHWICQTRSHTKSVNVRWAHPANVQGVWAGFVIFCRNVSHKINQKMPNQTNTWSRQIVLISRTENNLETTTKLMDWMHPTNHQLQHALRATTCFRFECVSHAVRRERAKDHLCSLKKINTCVTRFIPEAMNGPEINVFLILHHNLCLEIQVLVLTQWIGTRLKAQSVHVSRCIQLFNGCRVASWLLSNGEVICSTLMANYSD